MAKIVNKKEFDELLSQDKLLVADFFAPWCPPCKILGPEFSKLSDLNEDINMVKVDIDIALDLEAEHIQAGPVPQVVFYKNGKELHRFHGFKPNDEIQELIDQYK